MEQKKSTKILYAIWFFTAILASILAAGAIITDYDKNANYFLGSAPVFWAALVFVGISLISGIAAVFSTDIDKIRKSPFSKKPVFLPSSLCFAVMIVALNVQSLEGKTISNLITFIFTVLSLAIALFYSILSGQPQKIEQKPMQVAGFGLFTILAPLFVNIHFYFDVSVEMNAPLKLFVQIGLLLAMLYYTSELRYLLKKPTPRLFLMLSTATVSVGSLCALSLFVALITSRLPRLDYLAGAIVVIGVMITALIRMASLLSPEPTVSEDTTASDAQIPDSPNSFDDPSENI